MAVNETILKFAVRRLVLPPALVTPSHLELPIQGVPGVTDVSLAIGHDGARTITHVDGVALPAPLDTGRSAQDLARRLLDDIEADDKRSDLLIVSAADLDSIEGRNATRWVRVVGGGFRDEPQAHDARGHDVMAAVDTNTYCWELVCACGRTRYAKRNSVHQVDKCRICTTQQRKHRRSSSAQTTTR